MTSLLTYVLHRRNGVLADWHLQTLTEVNLPGSRATARLLLCPFHLSQAPLLLCQGSLQCRVFIMLLEALGAQLICCRCKYRLTKVFAAQFSHQSEARGGEEHLLSHWSGIRHICYSDEAWRGVVSTQEDVECFIGSDVRREQREGVGEARLGRSEELAWLQGFGRDGDDKPKVGRVGEEVIELIDELLRGWKLG